MTNEQLVALIRAHENEAERMLALWEQNKGFISKIALKYSGHAEMDDLRQEGYLGLCEAVRHYDSEKGIPFINYAAFWIRQGMIRYIDNCGNVVRIPSHARQDIQKYKRISGEYLKYYGSEPSERELCALLGVSRKKLRRLQEDAGMERIQSLSAPIGEEGEDLTLGDTVASGEDLEDECVRRLDREAMKRELWIAIDSLPADQAHVIQRRYMDGLTLRETGERQGVSAEYVRNISDKAMRTLRLPRRSRKYRAYYEQYLATAPVHHVGVADFQRTWTSEVELQAIKTF